jgi:hypothetical protein
MEMEASVDYVNINPPGVPPDSNLVTRWGLFIHITRCRWSGMNIVTDESVTVESDIVDLSVHTDRSVTQAGFNISFECVMSSECAWSSV